MKELQNFVAKVRNSKCPSDMFYANELDKIAEQAKKDEDEIVAFLWAKDKVEELMALYEKENSTQKNNIVPFNREDVA